MPKTKRDEGLGSFPANKKRHLDVLIEPGTEPRYLLHDYKSHDELLRIFDKVVAIEEELITKLNYDEGVAAIEGAKVDNKELWFLVRWETNQKSFVPAQVIKKIAPNKLLEFYESRLTFGNIQGGGSPPGLNKLLGKGAAEDANLRNQQKSSPPQRQAPPKNPVALPIMKKFRTMNCTGCKILLQYPEGTRIIRCPKCQTTMSAL